MTLVSAKHRAHCVVKSTLQSYIYLVIINLKLRFVISLGEAGICVHHFLHWSATLYKEVNREFTHKYHIPNLCCFKMAGYVVGNV